MSFHPRMFSQVKGFDPLMPVASRFLTNVVLDYWQVDSQPNAYGRYVSMYPRLVYVLDDRKLLVQKHKTELPSLAAALYVPAGMEISSSADGTGKMRHLDVHFSNPLFNSIVKPMTSPRRLIQLESLGGLTWLVETLAKECLTPQRDKDHVFDLLRSLVREHFHLLNNRNPQAASHQIDPARLEAIVKEKSHLSFSVDELASFFGLSRSQFDRLFRVQYAQSPKQWITQFKIERAKKQLLLGTRIVEVADQFGFSDQAHFSRVFKSFAGKSPRAWINGSS